MYPSPSLFVPKHMETVIILTSIALCGGRGSTRRVNADTLEAKVGSVCSGKSSNFEAEVPVGDKAAEL